MTDQTPRRRGRPRKGEEPVGPKWNTKLTNKGIERCPRCEFPEAYGGFCNECGWMEALIVDGKEWIPRERKTRNGK